MPIKVFHQGTGIIAEIGSRPTSSANLSPTAQRLIKDGELACTSIQQIVAQGRAAVDKAIAAADRAKVEKSVVTPALLVTKNNIDTVDLSSVVAPAGYRP